MLIVINNIKFHMFQTRALFLIDLSRNNISTLSEDNFKGQQNLLELNLSKNKLDVVASGTFKYLTVSDFNKIFKTLISIHPTQHVFTRI